MYWRGVRPDVRRLSIAAVLLSSSLAAGQAPSAVLLPGTQLSSQAPQPGQAGNGSSTSAQSPSDPKGPLLTRQDAERIAVANNPRVKVSLLLARVQTQVVRETRADLLPDVNGNVTGVGAN